MKNKEACTKVFKKCPYKWEEVMGMVGNLRNVITAHPMMEAIMDPNKTATATTGDKVVFLVRKLTLACSFIGFHT
jgi:hypothetical protein